MVQTHSVLLALEQNLGALLKTGFRVGGPAGVTGSLLLRPGLVAMLPFQAHRGTLSQPRALYDDAVNLLLRYCAYQPLQGIYEVT